MDPLLLILTAWIGAGVGFFAGLVYAVYNMPSRKDSWKRGEQR